VVLSLALFVTFFVSTPYLAAYIQLPGQTALSALPDRFLFIAASLAISALAALLVWDALGLEPRDTAILGPLPIAPWTITRRSCWRPSSSASPLDRHQCRAHDPLSDVPDREPTRVTMGGSSAPLQAQAISDHGGPLRFLRVLAHVGVASCAGETWFGRVSSGPKHPSSPWSPSLCSTIRGKTVTERIAGVVPPVRALPVLWHSA
jgi:hypothetical protein